MEHKLFSLCAVLMFFVFVVEAGQYFTYENGNKYFIEYENRLNWYEAAELCYNHKMSLITPDTEERQTEITQVLEKLGLEDFIWTSGQEIEKLEFIWTTTGKRLTFSNWRQGWPSTLSPKLHCIVMSQSVSFGWIVYACADVMNVLCEESPIKKAMNLEINLLKVEQTHLENQVYEFEKILRQLGKLNEVNKFEEKQVKENNLNKNIVELKTSQKDGCNQTNGNKIYNLFFARVGNLP